MKKVYPLLFALCLMGQTPAALLKSFKENRTVKTAALPAALCKGWVEVTSAEQEDGVAFYDIALRLAPHSRVLLGCSSSYVYALTLSGKVECGKSKAGPGEIMIWEHFASRREAPLVRLFSADHLRELFTTNGRAVDADLEALAARQKKLLWWGRLTPTAFNVASPAPKPVEDLRRSYQTQPGVIALKRAGTTHDDYAQRTAAAFATALKQHDSTRAAALLSPTVKGKYSAAEFDVRLKKDRATRAASILAQADYSALDTDRLTHSGGGVYTVPFGTRFLVITLAPFDDNLFVSTAVVSKPVSQ